MECQVSNKSKCIPKVYLLENVAPPKNIFKSCIKFQLSTDHQKPAMWGSYTIFESKLIFPWHLKSLCIKLASWGARITGV